MLMRCSLLAFSLLWPLHSNAMAADYKRIVSIGGDVTEIVFALGEGNRLVARDTTSTYPAEAKALPDAGYVRALSAEGILGMRPDAVLSSAGAGPPEQMEVLKAAGIPVATVPEGHDGAAITAKIEAVGTFLGRKAEADLLARKAKADLDEAIAAASRPADRQSRVLFILSLAGGKIVAAGEGSSADAMLHMAGAQNAVSGFRGFKALTTEAIIDARPDAILLMDRADHAAAMDQIENDPALGTTPAVRNRRIIRMDGLTLLGFGPRTATAVRDLSRALYGSKP